jgi:hypothetical protein
MKILAAFLLMSQVSLISYANACTWTAQEDVTCVYNGEDANVWVNDCPDEKHLLTICAPTSPATWGAECTAWAANPGVSCHTEPGDGVYHQEWTRICSTPGNIDHVCSDDKP